MSFETAGHREFNIIDSDGDAISGTFFASTNLLMLGMGGELVHIDEADLTSLLKFLQARMEASSKSS